VRPASQASCSLSSRTRSTHTWTASSPRLRYPPSARSHIPAPHSSEASTAASAPGCPKASPARPARYPSGTNPGRPQTAETAVARRRSPQPGRLRQGTRLRPRVLLSRSKYSHVSDLTNSPDEATEQLSVPSTWRQPMKASQMCRGFNTWPSACHAPRIRLRQSGGVYFPQVRALQLSEAVRLSLTETGVVGTWFVTGFPDLLSHGRGITVSSDAV
jgi:hypothetical protein